MKAYIILSILLLTGCVDRPEYVQIENKCNYKILIKDNKGNFTSLSPNEKKDVRLIDLPISSLQNNKENFTLSLIDKNMIYNYYFPIYGPEFSYQYLTASLFDKDRYLFKYQSKKLYLFDPKNKIYKEQPLSYSLK
ncbi:hypothetical protein NCZ17_05705 [Acinetobacter modestus]|uniref:hypothetical protein n=1 Tax=Acinetobacter modestus TaxID=1776740 RepID=UPI00202E5D33|nr:hypothetical protein [Acinetobacter modestus]MCM1958861.1 hypothetical protein [Acinetobacter modestus]